MTDRYNGCGKERSVAIINVKEHGQEVEGKHQFELH